MNTTDRDQLVIDHLPLVGYLVSSLCSRATHLDRDELASAGQFALFQASRGFDSDRGVPFFSYARTRVSGALADYLRSIDWVSRDTRKSIRTVLAASETLATTLGRPATVVELASVLGVDKKVVQTRLEQASAQPTSFDDYIDEPVSEAIGPEESAEIRERDAFINKAVAALPEKFRIVIQRIYFEDLQVKDVAEELGVTHAAVSYLRNEAVNYLREAMILHFDSDAGTPDEKPSAVKRAAYLDAFGSSLSTPGERITVDN